MVKPIVPVSVLLKPQWTGSRAHHLRLSNVRYYAYKVRSPTVRRNEAKKNHTNPTIRDVPAAKRSEAADVDLLIPDPEMFISATKAGVLSAEPDTLRAFLHDFLSTSRSLGRQASKDEIRKLCATHELPISTLSELSRLYSSVKAGPMMAISTQLMLLGCKLDDPLCSLIFVEKTFRRDFEPQVFDSAMKRVRKIAETRPQDTMSLRANLVITRYLMWKDYAAGLQKAKNLLKIFDSLPASDAKDALHAKLLYETAIAIYRGPRTSDRDLERARDYLEKAALDFDDAGAYWALNEYGGSSSGKAVDGIGFADCAVKAAVSGISGSAFVVAGAYQLSIHQEILDRWRSFRSPQAFNLVNLKALARFLHPSGTVSGKSTIRGTIMRLLFQLETWTWRTDTAMVKEWFRVAHSEMQHQTVHMALKRVQIMNGEIQPSPELWALLQTSSLSEADRRDAGEMEAMIFQKTADTRAQLLRSIHITDTFSATGRRIKMRQ